MNNISFRNDILPLKSVLYRLALRITDDEEEAKDMVQETLIKVWNKREEWNEIASIEAFCLTICRNLSLDSLKRHSHKMTTLTDLGQQGDNNIGPYEQMMQKDRFELVRKMVNSLPEKQRSCMQLRDFEGKSYKEIAMIMGISEDQVKVNIFRARQTIKERYQNIDNYGL